MNTETQQQIAKARKELEMLFRKWWRNGKLSYLYKPSEDFEAVLSIILSAIEREMGEPATQSQPRKARKESKPLVQALERIENANNGHDLAMCRAIARDALAEVKEQ